MATWPSSLLRSSPALSGLPICSPYIAKFQMRKHTSYLVFFHENTDCFFSGASECCVIESVLRCGDFCAIHCTCIPPLPSMTSLRTFHSCHLIERISRTHRRNTVKCVCTYVACVCACVAACSFWLVSANQVRFCPCPRSSLAFAEFRRAPRPVVTWAFFSGRVRTGTRGLLGFNV